MPWGLDGIQLSDEFQAIYFTNSGGLMKILDWFGIDTEELLNDAVAAVSPYYDFYLTRDNPQGKNAVVTDYGGHFFTTKIVEGTNIGPLSLDRSPQSAVEYCYNKNKRNLEDNGKVSTILWYLPAIDEIEEIAKGAYDEFDKVFQNEYYWSSQPAYEKWEAYITAYKMSWLGNGTGEYMIDDINRARATKIVFTDSFENINSGVQGFTARQNFNATFGGTSKNGDPEYYDSSKIIYDDGNRTRTEANRIRCVYRTN